MVSFEQTLEAARNSVAMSIDGTLYFILAVIDLTEPEFLTLVGTSIPEFGDMIDMNIYDLLENSEEIMFHPIDYENTVVIRKSKQ